MPLNQCTNCQGFVPPAAQACPNCGCASAAPQISGLRLPRAVMAVLGGVAIPVTLMACYGTGTTGPRYPCDSVDGSTPEGCLWDAGQPDAGTASRQPQDDAGHGDAG